MKAIQHYLAEHLPDMTDLLVGLVGIESQTIDKEGCDRMGKAIERELSALGAQVTNYPQPNNGDHLLGVFNRGAGSPIAMVFHMDTVQPRGTYAARFKIEDGRLYGPGAYDMKASHVIAIYALKALHACGFMPGRELRLLFTSDEETGSHTSRALIEQVASGCSLVMVMEPALEDGSLKSSRRGVGGFQVAAYGVAAHAGVDHQKGVNAIWELALQIPIIQSWTDYDRGVATTVSMIQAGVASNVIPDYAVLKVDCRVNRLEDAERISQQFAALHPHLPGARLEVSGSFDRPPMECTPERLRIFEKLSSIAAPLDIPLTHGHSGGGSDASYTAPIAPTMDGFGAVGAGGHALHEHVLLSSLVERAALNAAVLYNWV